MELALTVFPIADFVPLPEFTPVGQHPKHFIAKVCSINSVTNLSKIISYVVGKRAIASAIREI
jgi:hypothetical protein